MYAYGLRDIKIADEDGANAVDLPASRTLSFSEVVSSAQLEGDDVIVSVQTMPTSVEFSIEAGGISLDAYGKLTGRTPVDEGGGSVYLSMEEGDIFPYLRIYGQSMGDAGDDVHVCLMKAKITAIEGAFGQGEFLIGSCSGTVVPDSSGRIMRIYTHTTAENLDTTEPT